MPKNGASRATVGRYAACDAVSPQRPRHLGPLAALGFQAAHTGPGRRERRSRGRPAVARRVGLIVCLHLFMVVDVWKIAQAGRTQKMTTRRAWIIQTTWSEGEYHRHRQ